MISIKPIEQSALNLFNKDRFDGELFGYIMSDGKKMCGYSLFRIENDVTLVLEVKADDDFLFDGIIRASVAKGETEGAHSFACVEDDDMMYAWVKKYCKECVQPIANNILFCGECS